LAVTCFPNLFDFSPSGEQRLQALPRPWLIVHDKDPHMFEHPITFLKNASLAHATRIADSRPLVIGWMEDFAITKKDGLKGTLVRHSRYNAYNIRCK
jgi:hypothetical protein